MDKGKTRTFENTFALSREVDSSASLSLHQALGFQPPAGGLVLGAGGLGIPSRKCSPVSLRFQRTFCITGWTNLMAPLNLRGQTITQLPLYQHSSGYNTSGGLLFCGFGINTSCVHISTHMLQPLQISSLNTTGLLGVG